MLGSVYFFLAVTGRDETRLEKKGDVLAQMSHFVSRESADHAVDGALGTFSTARPPICQAQSAERRQQPVYLVALPCLSSAQDTRANVFGVERSPHCIQSMFALEVASRAGERCRAYQSGAPCHRSPGQSLGA